MKTITTVEMTCCSCGTSFAMDETLKELRLEDGRSFYCPNGHPQNYVTSRAGQLKKANDELQETKTELRDAQNEIRRLKCLLLAKPPQPRTVWQRLFSTNTEVSHEP